MTPGDKSFQHISKFLNSESLATITFSGWTTSSLYKLTSSLSAAKQEPVMVRTD